MGPLAICVKAHSIDSFIFFFFVHIQKSGFRRDGAKEMDVHTSYIRMNLEMTNRSVNILFQIIVLCDCATSRPQV